MNRKLDFWNFSTASTGIRTQDLHHDSWVSCHCTTYPTGVFRKLSPVKPIYYWGGRPLGTKPVFCDFPPLGVRSAKTQSVKQLRNFWEKLLGRTDFSPKSATSSGKLHLSVFGPKFLQVPRGCPRPKGPKIPVGPKVPVFCDFPPLGVRSAKTQNVKKLPTFRKKLLGRTDFSPKSAPSSGKLCFSVFAPEFL